MTNPPLSPGIFTPNTSSPSLLLSSFPLSSSLPMSPSSSPRLSPGQSALDDFCADLTALAVQGSIDPVIGRDKEVDRVVEILARRTKNNPILLGEPGVGKTAIAEGLALRIAENAVPAFLQVRGEAPPGVSTYVAHVVMDQPCSPWIRANGSPSRQCACGGTIVNISGGDLLTWEARVWICCFYGSMRLQAAARHT